MRYVNTHEAQSQLSALLALVEEKAEVVTICRNGRPIAELRAVARPRSLMDIPPNPRLQGIVFHEDPSLPLHASDYAESTEDPL